MYCIWTAEVKASLPIIRPVRASLARARIQPMPRRFFAAILATGTLALPWLLSGCAEPGDALDRIQSRGELRVVTRNSPTTYFTDRNGPTGFEYALAGRLAEELGVRLEMEPAFTLAGVFEKLVRKEADLAAAGLTLTEQRLQLFRASTPYYSFMPQVIYVAGTYRPRSVEDMADMSTVVLAESSLAESLVELQVEFPQFTWEEVPSADAMDLLELVAGNEAQLAILHSHEFSVQQKLYPRLKVAFDFGPEQNLVWYMAPGADSARLQAYIDDFIHRMQDNGTLDSLRKQYFERKNGISRISSHTFNVNMRNTLPSYLPLIKQVAEEYQLTWPLLAAIAYQESHWDPEAASPTGVRGMMMLTLPTAKEMGVKNRLDPAQSLRGGARYLRNIKRRLPKGILEPDRMWFALAAYNIGLGHLEDARVITQRQGGDPNNWRDVSERLPLLQKSKHYQDTRYGYARGVEAATYVQNIRHYQGILQWQDISENKLQPPQEIDGYLPGAIRGITLLAL